MIAVAAAVEDSGKGSSRNTNVGRKLKPCNIEVWHELDLVVSSLPEGIHTRGLISRLVTAAPVLRDALQQRVNQAQDEKRTMEGFKPQKKRITFNVPGRTAVANRIGLAKERLTTLALAAKENGRSRFSAEQEADLAFYLSFASSWDTLSTKKACTLLQALAKILFNENEPVSRTFFKRFRDRHKFDYQSVKELEGERINSRADMAKEVVELARTIARVKAANGMAAGKLPAYYIANLDEKPLFRPTRKAGKRALFKDTRTSGQRKQVRTVPISSSQRKSVTLELVMTANNDLLEPAFFFSGGKAETHPVLEEKAKTILESMPADQRFTHHITANGFIDKPSWRDYVEHGLLPALQQHRQAYAIPHDHWLLLTMDGAGTIHTTDPVVLHLFLNAHVVVYKHLAGSSTMRQANDNGLNAYVEHEFQKSIGSFERDQEKYHPLLLPKLISAVLLRIRADHPAFGQESFKKAGTYDASKDASAMDFLLDPDMLSAVGGATLEECRKNLCVLHAKVPEYDLNFLQRQPSDKFLDHYAQQPQDKTAVESMDPRTQPTMLGFLTARDKRNSKLTITRSNPKAGAWRSAPAEVTSQSYIDMVSTSGKVFCSFAHPISFFSPLFHPVDQGVALEH